MKRLAAFILVLMLGLSMIGCGQDPDKQNSVLGSWEAETEISILGVSASDDAPQSVPAVYCFDFSEDGTGEQRVIVDEEYAERFRDMNTSFTYVLDGDKLTLTHENGNTDKFTVAFSESKLILDGRACIELTPKK